MNTQTETLTTYHVQLAPGVEVKMNATELAAAYRAGVAKPDALAWREGLEEWLTVDSFGSELGLTMQDKRQAAASAAPVPHVGTPEPVVQRKPVARSPRATPGAHGMPGYSPQMVDQYGRPVVMVTAATMAPVKSRATFVIFALIFGSIGLHNFYAGYIWAGIFQALCSLLFFPLAILMWVVAVVECIFTVNDASGRRMK